MDKKVTVDCPVELTGIPIGVKEAGGVLGWPVKTLKIECMPTEIPEKISIDVTQLAIGDSIHVRDVSVPNVVIKASARRSAGIGHASDPGRGSCQARRRSGRRRGRSRTGRGSSRSSGTPGAAPAAGAAPQPGAAKAAPQAGGGAPAKAKRQKRRNNRNTRAANVCITCNAWTVIHFSRDYYGER